jgi:predicted RNase H-like nuclease
MTTHVTHGRLGWCPGGVGASRTLCCGSTILKRVPDPASGSCRSRHPRGSKSTIPCSHRPRDQSTDFALAKKILDVESCRAEARAALYEIHPEVSFWALAGMPLRARKLSWTGHAERRALLEAAGIVIPTDLGRAGLVAAADDVLDAAVAAWSAQRIASGYSRSLPNPPERDADGHPMAIWY